MNRKPIAWVFNLDAEDELAHVGAHTPTLATVARVRALLPTLGRLLQPGDVVLWPSAEQPMSSVEASRFEGRAWCPTRFALTTIERAGVGVPAAPSMEVLRRVNHRAFCAALGQTLPGAGFATNWEQLEALVVGEQNWLLKRPYGYAGRGRKKLRRGEFDRPWIDASFREGGLQVEPLVNRTLDCALHGLLTESGACQLGRPTVQDVDEHGAWRGSRVDEALPEREALEFEARRVAQALHTAGYFGPFGIDAFRWTTAEGEPRFQPRSEINARHSMGWATGFLT